MIFPPDKPIASNGATPPACRESALAVAQNPAAPADALATLAAQSNDASVLAAISANPNTPLDALLRLAGQFPAQFCANPITPFLLLENPSLPTTMSPAALGGLFRAAAVPRSFLEVILTYGHTDTTVVTAAQLHVQVVQTSATDPASLLRLSLWERLTALTEVGLLLELIGLGVVPPWLLAWLAADGQPEVRAQIGRSPATPAHILIALADDEHTLVRQAVLCNANTPATLQTSLHATVERPRPLAPVTGRTDAELQRRMQIASDPQTSPTALAQLKIDEDWGDVDRAVYESLAINPNTPTVVLEALAADQSWGNTRARRAVAQNPAASPQALTLLASDPVEDIRQAATIHPNMADAAHTALVTAALAQSGQSTETLYRMVALAHPQTASLDLADGATSSQWLERYALAHNPALPAHLRAHLVQDGNTLVRQVASTTRSDHHPDEESQ